MNTPASQRDVKRRAKNGNVVLTSSNVLVALNGIAKIYFKSMRLQLSWRIEDRVDRETDRNSNIVRVAALRGVKFYSALRAFAALVNGGTVVSRAAHIISCRWR